MKLFGRKGPRRLWWVLKCGRGTWNTALLLVSILRYVTFPNGLGRTHLKAWFPLQSTPINLEATPFIAAASPAGSSVPLPQMVWDPQLNAWQPCLEQETGLPSSVNTSALTPLSESSSSAAVKVRTPKLTIKRNLFLTCHLFFCWWISLSRSRSSLLCSI